MENKEVQEIFQYTYSAGEQEEIRKIRSRYMPKEEDALSRVRRLDAKASNRASMLALSTGILGTLLFGAGMSCCLVAAGKWLVPGIVLGVLGMAVCAAAYPLYVRVLKRERERIAPEIIRLTDILLK